MDFVDPKLKVKNSSNIEFGVLLNINYPDTTIEKTDTYYVPPNKETSISILNRYWDDFFTKNEKITLFLIEWDSSVKNHYKNYIMGFGEYKKKYTVLKKMVLSKKDLDTLNWVIKYP